MPKRADRRPPPAPRPCPRAPEEGGLVRLVQLVPGDEFTIRGRLVRHGDGVYPGATVQLGLGNTAHLLPGTVVELIDE